MFVAVTGVRVRVRVREHGSCSVYLPPRLADTESVIYRAILLARRQAATTVRRSLLRISVQQFQVLANGIHSDLVDLRHRIHHIPDSNIS